VTDWNRAADDYLAELGRRPAARAPATIGEIWDTEWKATGLDTTFGVQRPMMDAYSELQDRLTSITGKDLGTLARERRLDFLDGGFDGRIQTMGRIIDSLPDPQQKLLADYKDVRGRARMKAAEIERQSADVAGATYGLSGHAVAFAAGIARQMADPVNILTAPIGGPAKGPVLKWLGKEFLIGAGVQAAQEPFIATRRQELGLETNSIENVLEAGIGQAGFAGILRGAAALIRAGKQGSNLPPVDITARDHEAVARHVEAQDIVMRQTGPSREAADALAQATAALNGQAPIAAAAPARSAAFSLDGPQRVVINDELAFNVRYAVVERRNLVVSHSADGNVNPAFPPEIQPRDRSTMEMRQQLQDIAGKLEPSWLTTSPNAQFGAPIVSDRGIVESGNGRTLSIGLAYDRFPERAAAYRAELERLGFDIENFEQPVLVRIRQDDLSPQQLMAYTARSNVSEVAKLSVAEQAALDARNLHGGVLETYQGGDLTLARNAEFVRRFIQELVPVADQNAFISGGRPTEAGLARMQGALLARAWQDARMVREIAENPNPTSVTILRAFADTAPQISRLRAAIEEGRVDASADIVSPLKAAFNLVERARIEGRKLTMLVDQSDVETGAVRDDVRAAVRLFFRNDDLTVPAGRETIEARILDAVDRAIMSQAGGLFDEAIDPAAILRAARFATEPFAELSPTERARLLSEAAGGRDVATGRLDAEAARTVEPTSAEAGKLLEATAQTPAQVLEFRQAKLEQPFTDLNRLFELAPAAQKELIDALEATGRGTVKNPGIKARDGERGIEAKVAKKGYSSIREVTDVARAAVIIDRPTDADAVIQSLSSRFTIWDEGWKLSDVGYADRKVMVRTSNGLLAEVQILEKSYAATKSAGHKLYAKRELALKNGDVPAAKQILQQEKDYWRPVQAALPDDWRAALGLDPKILSSAPNAASANAPSMTRPSSPIYAEFTGSQPRSGDNTNPSSVSSSTTASRASQLNSLNEPSDMGTSEGRVARGDAEINARVKSMMNEIGPETRLPFEQADGTMKDMTVAERMAEVDKVKRAAAELNDCIARNGGGGAA